jgi:hypothetical protein
MNRTGKHVATLLLTLLVLFIFCDISYGQKWKLRRYEIGGGIGVNQLFGDIGGSASSKNLFGLKDINLNETRYGFNALARYKVHPKHSVKASLHGGIAKGDDKKSHNNRGRSYSAFLFEFSGQYEYYIIQEEKAFRSSGMYSRRGMLNNYSHYALYGFAGLGVVYSNSKHKYPLPPLPKDIYKSGGNYGVVIPFGIGTKFIIDSRYSLNAEFGYRYTFSDYIEGYSNTDSKYNDIYYFLDFTLTYRLKTTTRNLPAIIDKRYKKYGY